MNNQNSHFSIRLLVLDFLLLNISFFLINFWKRGTIVLSLNYVKLLIVFYFIWLIVSLLIRKYEFGSYKSYADSIILFGKSAAFNAYVVSLMVVILGVPGFSRIHVFGTCLFLFFLNAILFSIFYLSGGKSKIGKFAELNLRAKLKSQLSVVMILGDFLIITAIFFGINYLKRETFVLPERYEQIVLIVYGLWFVTSLITRKFDKRNFQNYYYAMTSCLKAVALMTLTMSVLFFAFRLFYFSRGQVFGSFLLLIMIEAGLYYMYFAFRPARERARDVETIDEVRTLLGQKALREFEKEDINFQDLSPVSQVKEKLREKILVSYPWLFNFIDDSIDLGKIGKKDVACLSTHDIFNVKTIDDNSLRLFINLHKINDIRWVNRYFLEVYKKMVPGGYFVGSANTVFTDRKWFFDHYPKYFAEIFFFLHFVLFRLIPKLPGIKKVYFSITEGTNRTISRAEVLGRLCFCGFEIIEEKEIDYKVFFIAKKVRTASVDRSPTYGPIVELKRTGLNGRMITVYKFRTMHPYAEYLQDYVYMQNSLRSGGKMESDFRVTGWGELMRRLWLDELPMIYNWIRGELKLIGVRPLSMQYLGLYPADLKGLRSRVKPGLIPPFYADMPKTFNEICESERKYLEAYLEKPARTQWVYFWKAFYNIIIKGARSH
jgi:Bacterial sugar transferase